VKALVQKGYDQSSVEVITQTPNPDPISWANSIRKFSAIGADLIVTYGAPATLVALREAGDIPIVFADVYGPLESGVAKGTTSTGHNMAGVSCKVPLVTLVKTAQELKLVQLRELRRIAAQLGFGLTEVNLAGASGLDAALATLFAARVDYIYVSECSAGSRGFDKIVHRAGEQKVPVLSQMPGAAQRGALLSLEADPVEQGQVAADYAARILGGKKASGIAVATPKRVELIVNMKTARALDLQVPFPVLSAATRVLK
jgi:putative tryptophan/tyrosine transport system substrate-binding protein